MRRIGVTTTHGVVADPRVRRISEEIEFIIRLPCFDLRMTKADTALAARQEYNFELQNNEENRCINITSADAQPEPLHQTAGREIGIAGREDGKIVGVGMLGTFDKRHLAARLSGNRFGRVEPVHRPRR